MSYKDYRVNLAAQILSGFAANPAIFQPNERCGWSLVNATDSDIAGYAIRLADELLNANDQMPQKYFPAQNGDQHGPK